MPLVTVLTPTYNRAHMLKDLFLSLQSQSSKNFEWLVIDDGSNDDTKDTVDQFIRTAAFPVRYLRKENGGKHTALNAGIARIHTELTFIVDSDDTVLPNGISRIEYYYEKYKNEPNIGVYSFLKTSTTKGILLKMPQDELVGSYITERIRKNRPGDMAEVFLTKALREFPFPEFPGERFLSEDVVWIPLGMKYRTVFINEAIYQFEYLFDGLTRNDKKHKFASPLGSMMRGKMLMNPVCGLKANIRGAIIYGCYKRSVEGAVPPCVALKHTREKVLVSGLFPVSAVFLRIWKRQSGE